MNFEKMEILKAAQLYNFADIGDQQSNWIILNTSTVISNCIRICCYNVLELALKPLIKLFIMLTLIHTNGSSGPI